MRRLVVAGTLLLGGGGLAFALSKSDLFASKSEADIPVHVAQSEVFERSVPAEGYLQAEKATPLTAPLGRTALRVAWLKDNGSAVKKDEVVVRFDDEEFKRKLADGESDAKVAAAQLGVQRAQIDVAAKRRERDRELAKEDLARAQERDDGELDEIFSAHEILKTRIDGQLSEAKAEHADKVNVIDRSIARSQIELLDIQKQGAAQSISMAEAGLSRMEVVAPHDGIFVYRNSDLAAGSTVFPGQELGNLPLTEVMEAEVFVLEADAMGLAEGKDAVLRLESQPEKTHKAKIKSIAKLAARRQQEVPIQYFAVVLSIETTDPKVMKPGQRVQASLQLDKKEAIVVPRHCIFEEAGEMVAFVERGDTFEAVPVTLGVGTPGRVVVESGIKAGDRLATRHPFKDSGASSDEDKSKDQSAGAQAT